MMSSLESDRPPSQPAVLGGGRSAAERPYVSDTSHWLLVLCLVGLDYFSTLAYLPSLAVEAAGPLAPLAALAVVLVTLFLALPVYTYVVGRSATGRGAAGLLEQVMPGWRGKILVLTLLGFAAADYVITRSLSVADAAVHVAHNPHGHVVFDQLAPLVDRLEPWLGSDRFNRMKNVFTRQVVISLGLAVLSFGCWQLMQRGFTRKILKLAMVVVVAYLVMSAIVIGSGLIYLWQHPELGHNWWQSVEGSARAGQFSASPWKCVVMLTLLALWAFPQLALGLSGFELTMTIAPLVSGGAPGSPDELQRRARNTYKLLTSAVTLMSVYLLGSVFVTTLLIPHAALDNGGPAEDRALAYLAHGGLLFDGQPSTQLCGLFGDVFGTLFDGCSVMLLCLAGASVVSGLRGILPHYLHRLGMTISWAGKTEIVMHLLNGVIMVVTVVFHASLSAQQWAYATSVLVLLAGASLSAMVDVFRRWRPSVWRWIVAAPFGFACGFFLSMTLLTAYKHWSGIVIALAFVASILVTSFFSRWLRSKELRFDGFDFFDETARERWEIIRRREFQVVIPHRPGAITIEEKIAAIRRDFRVAKETPLLIVQALLGDPSDFYHRPLIQIENQSGWEVVRVSKCVSVSHVMASLCLALCQNEGRPPEVIFGWSAEPPLAANLHFLLLGEGNVPWMVKELVRNAEPDLNKQPRILLG